MTLRSTCRGFGRTYHSTAPNLDAKNDRIRRALADIPAATPAQMAVFERQNTIRKHYAHRKRLAGCLYNELSLKIDRQLKAGEIDQEQAWLRDDALLAKVRRIHTQCEILRDARIAAVEVQS